MLQHTLERDNKNPPATPALDEFCRQNAGFKSFAEANGVGNENPLPRLLERLQRRIELIRGIVHHSTVAEIDIGIVGRAAPQIRLKIQEGGVEMRACIGNKFRLRWIENRNLAFELGEKLRGRAADQIGHAIAVEKKSTVAGWVYAP